MITNITPGFAALLGVLLGGGFRAIGTWWARRRDAEALLSGLAAEVEGLVRLARHRLHLEGLQHLRSVAQLTMDAGNPEQHTQWMVLTMKADYFATYHASVGKIGTLSPYQADRITRFYLLAKAALENYHPDAAQQAGISAQNAVATLDNDIMILMSVYQIGDEIAGFRKVRAPLTFWHKLLIALHLKSAPMAETSFPPENDPPAAADGRETEMPGRG